MKTEEIPFVAEMLAALKERGIEHDETLIIFEAACAWIYERCKAQHPDGSSNDQCVGRLVGATMCRIGERIVKLRREATL